MKRTLLLGMVLGLFYLTSCSQNYLCTNTLEQEDGQTITSSIEHTNLSKSEAQEWKDKCEEGGGVWSAK